MRQLLILLPALLLPITINAARLHPERWYQDSWCEDHHGEAEHILPDLARVDCLTDTHAIEFDFADKWAESIGQALYYAGETGREPGIAIIVENPAKDLRYIQRLHNALSQSRIKIRLWIVVPE